MLMLINSQRVGRLDISGYIIFRQVSFPAYFVEDKPALVETASLEMESFISR